MLSGDRVAVLVAAGGAAWESAALRTLAGPGLAVVRRCVDVTDLLAAASAGAADVAVVSGDLPGLDAAAVLQLLRHDVRTVAVDAHAPAGGASGPASGWGRLGVVSVVAPPGSDAAGSSALADAVRRAAVEELVADPDPLPGVPVAVDPLGRQGRVVAVWGPAGAPGRTTVAIGLAAELADRGQRVVLADLDPYGGAVAQQLGVLDEVSGLLAAARLVNAGELDQRRFAGTRRLAAEHLELLTGLPRPDRWVEVRDGAVDEILTAASRVGHVVVDVGFALEDETDLGRTGPGRNRMTLDALGGAAEVVVVGSAEPVGLSRLARGLVEITALVPGVRLTVAVNRMRDSLGWAEDDIRGMIEGFARPYAVHFLPEDRTACDRALVAGRALTESGDSTLRRALAALATSVFPESVRPGPAGPGGSRVPGLGRLGRSRRRAS